MSALWWPAVLTGAGATLIMDAWALVARRLLRMPLPDYCLVGRWLAHMPEGRFRHASIAKAAPRQAECAIGWSFHYLVGLAYAFLLVLPSAGAWLLQPSLLPALLVGVGTLVMPWGLMQPAFGLGVAAARTADPRRARLRSLLSHVAFGVGLYLAAVPVSRVLHTLA